MKLRIQVISSEVDPQARDRLRRWLVVARVREVLAGTLDPQTSTISLLVHSPARTFMDPEIVGREYVVTLQDELSTPYMGELSVEA